ncbi:cytochrome P450 [Salinactinospora qingdaonensis]|uniref:Cytochrome P450 n=1 Tax=Salinactinospora qingdaonensis TaxID=702744 RepID=A0ABP7G631_9ACTN
MSTYSEAGPPTQPPEAPATAPPGPRAPQPVQALMFMRDPIGFLHDCQRRYGPIFTIKMLGSPGMVMVADPELAHRVFSTDRDIGHAGQARADFLEPLVGAHSLLTLDGQDWMRQRKMLGSAFHGKHVQGYRAPIATIAAQQVERWPTGRPVTLRPRFQAITLEVILRVVFGVTDSERLRRLTHLLPRLLAATESLDTLMFLTPPWLWRRLDPLLTRTPATPNARFATLRRATDAIIYDEIAQRRDSAATERTDILSTLLSARDGDGTALNDEELRDALITLLLAGHETTATALAWCFERLMHNPEVEERARQAAVAGDAAYLTALAKETLRTRPIVGDMPRVLSEPLSLGGYRVPRGWWVSPAPLLTHASAALFPQPEEFRPERFLTDEVEPNAWMPFGGGRRQCLGAQFALLEMSAVLPEVLTRVRLRPAGDAAPEKPSLRHVTLAPARDVPVVAHPEPSPRR